MKLKDYLKENNMTIMRFSQSIGLNRATLSYYIHGTKKIPLYVKLAIEYVTLREVTVGDWDENSD